MLKSSLPLKLLLLYYNPWKIMCVLSTEITISSCVEFLRESSASLGISLFFFFFFWKALI